MSEGKKRGISIDWEKRLSSHVVLVTEKNLGQTQHDGNGGNTLDNTNSHKSRNGLSV